MRNKSSNPWKGRKNSPTTIARCSGGYHTVRLEFLEDAVQVLSGAMMENAGEFYRYRYNGRRRDLD